VFLFRKKDPKLPPNQKAIGAIMGWGTQHPGIVKKLLVTEKAEWSLTVDGEVENPLRLDWEGFMALPQVESVSDFHCVEGWSVLDQRWEGVLFKTLAEKAGPRPACRYVWFECYDGYTTSLPLEKLMDEDVVIANRLNGQELPQPLGGPVRLVVPKLYAYKSPMWLRGITFMEEDRLGYWESGIYSNTADPWKNDRYNR
jgi:DMSO/TMAO reductase YedYZ molybdopterin-dependent catalytic subunit